jgi:hypothetical protein
MWGYDDFANDYFDRWDAMEELNIEVDMDWDDELQRWMVESAETGRAF